MWIEHTKSSTLHCGHYQPTWTKCGIYIQGSYDWLKNKSLNSPIYQKEISGKYLYRSLYAMSNEDIEKLGLDPEFSPPYTFMISVLPFPPHCIRPNRDQTDDDTIRGRDDLTYALMLIIRANENLKIAIEKEKTSRNEKKKRKFDQFKSSTSTSTTIALDSNVDNKTHYLNDLKSYLEKQKKIQNNQNEEKKKKKKI